MLRSGTLCRLAAQLIVFCVCSYAARAGTTWTGGGADTSWATAGNWGGALPAFDGTAALTIGSGFASGSTLNLNGSRYISSLSISTTSAFTVAAGTGGTLNVRSGNVTRSSSPAVAQTISAGVILGDPTGVAAYTGTWNIAGTNTLTISGDISEAGGARGLTFTGAGAVKLSGNNTFTGTVAINAGTVYVTRDASLGASSGGLTMGGGILDFQGNATIARPITLTAASGFYVDTGFVGELSGTITGNQNLALGLNGGTLILSGAGNNGTGVFQVWNGTVSLRGSASLGTGIIEIAAGSVLELGNGNLTKPIGSTAGHVWLGINGSSGFAAWGADRIVNLGGAGATMTWNTGGFTLTGTALLFGSTTSNATLDFQNGIDLAGAARTVTLTKGSGTGAEGKLSGIISGSAAASALVVTSTTDGRLLLSNGNNSYAGTTTVSSGALWLGANATSGAGNTVLGSSSSAVSIGNTTGAYNASLLSAAPITISRNLSVVSGNTGTISIGGVTADNSSFSGSLTLGSTTTAGHSASLTAAAGSTVTFSGVIADPTGLTGAKGVVSKEGAGTVSLTNVNTYGGGTQINAGTLSINGASSLGASAGGLTINAGTLEVTSTFSTSRSITVSDSASTFQVDPSQIYTVTSAIGGGGSLNKTGTGTMQLSGANTYSGSTVVSAGTLQTTANERIANGTAVTINSGGTLDLQGNTETVAAVTLAGGAITGTSAGSLTGSAYDVQSGSASAVLAGTVTMTKTTTGTVTLTGANTFTGSTTISGGTLTLAATSGGALASTSGITVNSGGTLQLGASNQINNTAGVTLAGGTFAKSTYSEGSTSTPGVGALTLTAAGSHVDFGTGTVGALTFASLTPNTNTLVIDNWTGTAHTVGSGSTDRLVFNSDQTANLSYFSFTGYAPGATEFALGGGYFEVVPTAVPEPATYASAALAVVAIVLHRRARRKRS